jgi:hypothetical protein
MIHIYVTEKQNTEIIGLTNKNYNSSISFRVLGGCLVGSGMLSKRDKKENAVD